MRESQGLCSLLLSPASQLFLEPPRKGWGHPFTCAGRTCLPASIHQGPQLFQFPLVGWLSGLVVAVIYLDQCNQSAGGWEQLGCVEVLGRLGSTSPFPLSLLAPGPEGCLLSVQSPSLWDHWTPLPLRGPLLSSSLESIPTLVSASFWNCNDTHFQLISVIIKSQFWKG